MGQYHYVCNLDKKHYLNPDALGDGLKLMEFGSSAEGTLLALALLLATANGRGGGDFRGEDPVDVIGTWGGDRIAIIGDYHEPGDVPGFTDKVVALIGGYNPKAPEAYDQPLVGDVPWNQSDKLNLGWKDISPIMRATIETEGYVKFVVGGSGYAQRMSAAEYAAQQEAST
jgi:hypothetical protein